MSNPGDWNGKLTVPKPFNLRTSAPQPKPNNKPATVTNRQNPAAENSWKPKLTQPVPFKLSQGGASNRKEFSVVENPVPWNKNTAQAQSSGASGLSWNLGNTKKTTEFQEFSRFSETRQKLLPEEINERLQLNSHYDRPRSTHLTIPMSPNLRTNKKVIQRPAEPQHQEHHAPTNHLSKPLQLTVPMSPHLRTSKKVTTHPQPQPQKQEDFMVVENNPKPLHLTVPMSPNLRTNKKLPRVDIQRQTEAFSALTLNEPAPVANLPQPNLKRKFNDDHSFIAFKSPLKKSEKKILGLKTPEPLTKSLLKKKSAKQLEEYERSKEQPFEINEEDFEDNSNIYNNLLSDSFNLHSMEEDEASEEEYDIMNHILKETGATPTKKIKLSNTTTNKGNLVTNNENERSMSNKSTKKAATFAQPKQQAHINQQQQQQQQVIITKRPLTVPQSPKLFTKRLR